MQSWPRHKLVTVMVEVVRRKVLAQAKELNNQANTPRESLHTKNTPPQTTSTTPRPSTKDTRWWQR